jgi:lipoyl synthase
MRVALAVKSMALKYVVLTSVTRDDLDDGGAGVFAETIEAVRREVPGVMIEVLTPDFRGSEQALDTVFAARPDVFGHNLETVRRLQPLVRPEASYERSLAVLRSAATRRPGARVKSGLMLGLGEVDGEVFDAMGDLAAAGCELLTLGQYLSPTRNHLPVARYVTNDEFQRYADVARRLVFTGVFAGPLVRSSYRAEELVASLEGD